MKKLTLTSLLLAAIATNASAAVEITEANGWFEGGHVTWTNLSGADSYNVYCRPEGGSYVKLDTPLVRDYGTYGRADIVGITAGSYQFKVVPVNAEGEMTEEAAETALWTAAPYDRGGFAHFATASSTFNPANGVGAYKNDGTLKAGAKVIYVYADNAKTITTDVITTSKGGTTTGVGLQNIIDLYEKGYDKTPIDFRIIGAIKAADMDNFSSSAEGLQIKGRGAYSEMNITIEGIGQDATIHGFGFLIRNACSVELRNFAIMWCMDDAVSMDTDNSNLWVHNLDLFYGRPGGAADQKKGDGTLDIKGDSKYSTLSYNHLWDSGKASLCGMKSESGPNYLTYHHNWFDHSDSRHPRTRTMTVHVYNNYYDGNSKYGIGATTGADIFAENNYFRNCKYPMLSSKQGSDVHNGQGSSDDTKGTFSGEEGGSIKAFGNYMTGQKSFEAYDASSSTYSQHFDAYVASSRDEQVPATMVALLGGDTYSNFDTDPALMYTGYTCHAAAEVPSVVKGELGAGRCQHGDFKWTFGANEDNNAEVISTLSTAIQNYKSTLVGFYGQPVSNGGGNSGDNSGSSNEGTEGGGTTGGDDSGDSGESGTYEQEIYLGSESEDFFWFNEENAETVNTLFANGTLSFAATDTLSGFKPTYSNTTDGSYASTVQTGSIQLAKASAAGSRDGGYLEIKCPKGVTSFQIYTYRTGSVYLDVDKSNDGTTFTKIAKVEKASKGINRFDFTTELFDTAHYVVVRIYNTSTGGLNIQGVQIRNLKGAQEMQPGTSGGGNTDPDPGNNPGGEGGGSDDSEAGSFSYADNAIYAFQMVKTFAAAEKDGAVMNYSDTIATIGGHFLFGNVSKIEANAIAAHGYAMKLDGNASASNTKYALALLNEPLQAGDVVTLSCFCTSNPSASSVYGLTVFAGSQTGAVVGSVNNTAKNTEEKLSFTVGAASAGETKLFICRNTDKSTYFTGIEVTREGYIQSLDSVSTQRNLRIYDLQGRAVANPVPGRIYIMGGKKVLF